ncbi:MAG: O-antigen ligase family protein [Coxiellaceae bacterium]|nr:O-antigen ligase family protein [Coxiellaceae bacterium]
MHQSTLCLFAMILPRKKTLQIETVAQGTAVATLLALPISTTGTLAFFFLTTFLILLSGNWTTKWSLIKNNPIALTFFTFFAIYLLGTAYTIGSRADIREILLRFCWLLLTPLWIPLFIEKKWQQRGINAFLIAMTITLILSFFKYFNWIHSLRFWSLLNHRLVYSHASIFKDYIIQSFLMSITAIIFFHRFMQNKQWLYAILFLGATTNIFFISQSRTGYLIFILLFSYAVFSQMRLKKALTIFASSIAILAAALIILPSPIHTRSIEAIRDVQQWDKGEETTSLGYRMAWQINALNLIKQRPILGYGTGSIKAAYATLPKKDTEQTGVVNNSSSGYLNIAIQFGIVGLIITLGMLLLQWRYSFFLPKEQSLLIQAMLIAICVGNIANSWFMDFTQGHFYALVSMLSFAPLTKRLKPSKAQDHAYNDDVSADIHAENKVHTPNLTTK